jgi:hypothetical protein
VTPLEEWADRYNQTTLSERPGLEPTAPALPIPETFYLDTPRETQSSATTGRSFARLQHPLQRCLGSGSV